MSFDVWKTLSQINASKSEAVQKFIKEFKFFAETRAKAQENLRNPDAEVLSQLIRETQILERYAGLMEWFENLLDQFPTHLRKNAVFKEIEEENPDWARAIENFSRLSGGLKTPDSYSGLEVQTMLLLKTFEEANLEPFWKRIHAEREKEIKKDPHYQTRKQMADGFKEIAQHLTFLEKLSNHQTKLLSPAELEETRQNLERSLSLFSHSLGDLPKTLETEFRQRLVGVQQGDVTSLIAGTELAIRLAEELLVAGMKKENRNEPSLDLYYDRLRRDIAAKDLKWTEETLDEFFNRLDSLSLLTSVGQTITTLEENLPAIEAFYRERPRQWISHSTLDHYRNVIEKLSEIKKLLKEDHYEQAVRKFTALNSSKEFKNLNLDLEMAGIHALAKGMALALLTASLAGVAARLLTLAMIPRTALAVEQAGADGAFLPTAAQIWGYRFAHGGNFVLGERLASNLLSGEAVFRERGFGWNTADLVEDSILMTGLLTSAGAVSARFVNFTRESLRWGEAGQQLARVVGSYVGLSGWEGVEKTYEKGVREKDFAPLEVAKEALSFSACRDRGAFLAGLHFADKIIHAPFNPLTYRLMERAGRKALQVKAIQLDHERVAVLKALSEHPYLKESADPSKAPKAKLGFGLHLLNRLMRIAKGRLEVLKTLRRSLPDGTDPREVKVLDEMIAQEEQAYKNADQFKTAVRRLNGKKHPSTAEVGKVFEEKTTRLEEGERPARPLDQAASRKKFPRKPTLRRPERETDPAAKLEKQALDFGRRHFGWQKDFKPEGSVVETVRKELRRGFEDKTWRDRFPKMAKPEDMMFAALLMAKPKTEADPQTIEAFKRIIAQAKNLQELWERIGIFSEKQIPVPGKRGGYVDIHGICVAIFDFHFERLPEAYGIKAKAGELLKEAIVHFGRRHFGFETLDRDTLATLTPVEVKMRFESETIPHKEWMENFWKTASMEDKKMALYLYTGRRGHRYLPPRKARELIGIIGQYGKLDIEVSADLILRDDGTLESIFMRGEWNRTKAFGVKDGAVFPLDHTHPDDPIKDYGAVFPSAPDLGNSVDRARILFMETLSTQAILEREGVTVEGRLASRVLHPDGGVIYIYDPETNIFHLFFGVKDGNKDPYRPEMKKVEAMAKKNGWNVQWHDLDYEKIARRDLEEVRKTLKRVFNETPTQKLLTEAPPLPDRNDPSEKHWQESSRLFTDYVRRLEKLVREGVEEAIYKLEKLIVAGESWAIDLWKEAALKNPEIIGMWRENIERDRRGWKRDVLEQFLATFNEKPLTEAIDKGEFRQVGGMSHLPPPVLEKLKPNLKNMPVAKLTEAAAKGDHRAVGQLKILAKSYQNEGAQTALANLDCSKFAEDYAKRFGQPEEKILAMTLGNAAEVGNTEAMEILLDQAERGSVLAGTVVALLPMTPFIEKIKADPQDIRILRLVFDVMEMGNDEAVVEMASLVDLGKRDPAKAFPSVLPYLKVMSIEKTLDILENGHSSSAIRAFRTIALLASAGHEEAERVFGDFLVRYRSGDKRAQEIFAQLKVPAKDSKTRDIMEGKRILDLDEDIARITGKNGGNRGGSN